MKHGGGVRRFGRVAADCEVAQLGGDHAEVTQLSDRVCATLPAHRSELTKVLPLCQFGGDFHFCRGSADAVSGVTSTTTTHHRTAPSKASPEQLSELFYLKSTQICKHITTPKIDPKQASMSIFPTSADQTDDGVELPAPCLTTSRRSLMKVGEVVHHHPRRTPMVNRWWLCAVV